MTIEEAYERNLPTHKLWEPVPAEVYDAIYSRLEQLRENHGFLTDKNLLTYIACEITMGIAKGEIPNPHDRKELK